jgi:hypothetical protein
MNKFQLEINEKLSLKVGLIGLRVRLFGVSKFFEERNAHCCRRLSGSDHDQDCKFEVCGPGLGLSLAGWLGDYIGLGPEIPYPFITQKLEVSNRPVVPCRAAFFRANRARAVPCPFG